MSQAEDSGTGELALDVSVDDTYRDAATEASRALMAHPVMRHEFQAGDLWLVAFDVGDKDTGSSGVEPPGSSSRFSALVQETGSGRMLAAEGHLRDPSALTVHPMSHQRSPGDEEFAWAVEMLKGDDETRALLEAEGSQTYRPMPPLVNISYADGTVDRVITVGIRSEAGEPRHRIVGVRTSDGIVVGHPDGVPMPSAEGCGAPIVAECPPTEGPGRVRVRVSQGDIVLWDLLVVRPSHSSGTNGSGVELRRVDYRRQRVLARAHVPVVNVEYGPDGVSAGCGPTHRDWAHEEGCFTAPGSDVAPGFRLCTGPPTTILDSGTDGGDFRGVAIRLDGDELVIVSQLQAGWYRYVSEWRLLADGTIRPRFGFAAVDNPCTCDAHAHHVYWRFDFDILGHANNLVQEHNDPPIIGTSNWHTTRYEVRRARHAAANRFWRVRSIRSSQGYSLMPGPGDGEADPYGIGDVWILRYHDSELDDGQGYTDDQGLSRANIDRFVSGESVERQDVVLWYATHFRHPTDGDDTDDADGAGRRVGPDLVPSHWGEIDTGEGLGPVEPPVRP